MTALLKRKSFLIALASGAVIVLAVAFLNRGRGDGLLRLLCDGCFVAGILVGGAGCLVLAGNEGIFDVFGYGISFVLNVHWSGIFHMSEERRKETYADYKARKRANPSAPGGLLLAGGLYLVLAAVMLIICSV